MTSHQAAFATPPSTQVSLSTKPFKTWERWCLLLLLCCTCFIGLGANAQTPVPAALPASLLEETVQQVVSGNTHTCALTTAGTVKCWGLNLYGQLGNATNSGNTAQNINPLDVTGLVNVTALAAGGDFTCALTTTGTVKCWGLNTYGQLGSTTNSGTSTPNNRPLDVQALDGVTALAASPNHTCALTTVGTVKCWGLNLYGQLGNTANSGTQIPNNSPLDVQTLNGVTALATSQNHTCALTTAGTVKCWGLNFYGQLGNTTNSGIRTPNNSPLNVPSLINVTALAAGGEYTCALTTAGSVKCWGLNQYGQLGNTSNSGTLTPNNSPLDVQALNGVTALAAGQSHTCALTTAGTAKCWGLNKYGQLGSTTNSDISTPNSGPVDVTGLINVTTLAASGYHTCALTTAGTAKCWGLNQYGQLGNIQNAGTTNPNPTPTGVRGFSGIAKVVAGFMRTCALSDTGSAKCWGFNNTDQLGNTSIPSSDEPHPTPLDVTGLNNATALALGANHSCALISGGTVKCWGFNTSGQLGNNAILENTPMAVDVTGLTGVTALALGDAYSCALISGGTLKCWGSNFKGQLGNTANTDTIRPTYTPVSVTNLSNVTALTAGSAHTCALISGGTVKCWGSNEYGQLGNMTNVYETVSNTSPLDVTGLTGVTALTAGNTHTCALILDGTVKCWGKNTSGQLGDGTTSHRSTPASVTGLTDVTALAAGNGHTCALTAANTIKCWGSNASGQLGNASNYGASTANTTPLNVTGLTGATSLTAAMTHTCALTNVGALKCWGANEFGQLGNNSTANTNIPASILTSQQLRFAPGFSGTPLNTLPQASVTTLAATSSVTTGSTPITYGVWTPNTCSVDTSTNALVATGPAGSMCGVYAARSIGDDGAGGTTAAAPTQSRLLLISTATPALTLSSSLNPSSLGTAVTLTATFTQAASPAGLVTFKQGATTLCPDISPSGMTAKCTTSVLAVGSHNLTAEFAGDVNNAPTTSLALTQVVNSAVASAPNITTVVPGDGQVTINWTAPTSTGSSPITGYTATALTTDVPPQIANTCTAQATATFCTITGLNNGSAYLFNVYASNGAADGAIASTTVPVTPVASVHVPNSNGNLPAAIVGKTYSAIISPAGGIAPYHFSITAGSLPPGLRADMSSDNLSILITGTPTQSGTANFMLSISDSTVPVVRSTFMTKATGPTQHTATLAFSIAVASADVMSVPLLDGLWEKLLLSVMLLGIPALLLRARKH